MHVCKNIGYRIFYIEYFKIYPDFPDSTVVKTSLSNTRGEGSVPGQGPKIPQASWPKKQNMKQKQDCNKFNKDFNNGPHQKIDQQNICSIIML